MFLAHDPYLLLDLPWRSYSHVSPCTQGPGCAAVDGMLVLRSDPGPEGRPKTVLPPHKPWYVAIPSHMATS